MLRSASAVLALLLSARAALAHDVPILPSICTFDPLTVSFPAPGTTGIAVPPGLADRLRIVYTPRTASAQFDAATVPSRALTGLGASASLALPAVFDAALLASGDFTAAGVPLLLTVDGTPATVPVTLTTGLAPAGGAIEEGDAMDASGRLTLVATGVVDGLAAPLGGAVAVFRLTCSAAPVPDLDQFPLVTAKRLGGRMGARGVRLRARLSTGSLTPDFTQPVLLHVRSGDTSMVQVSLPDGLSARGRRAFVGASADGATVSLRLLRRRPTPLYALSLTSDAPPVEMPGGTPAVTLTAQLGEIVARVSRTFRANRAGTALAAR